MQMTFEECSQIREWRFGTSHLMRYNGLAIQRGKVVIRNRIRANIAMLSMLLCAVRSLILWCQYRRHAYHKFRLSGYALFDLFFNFGNNVTAMYWHLLCVLGFSLGLFHQFCLMHSERFMGLCELAKLDENLERLGKKRRN